MDTAADDGGRLLYSDSGEGRSMADRAHREIANAIRQRRIRGGEVIVESRLAASLGLSRTPLREALQRLEGEGLVVRGAGRSLVVRHVDLKEYLQSLKVREIAEPEAAALACGRVDGSQIAAVREEIAVILAMRPYSIEAHWKSDSNLHDLFIDQCGNDVLINIIRQLRTTTHLFEIARLSDRLGPDATEHLAILDALEANDTKAVRRAVQTHLRSLYRFAVDALE